MTAVDVAAEHDKLLACLQEMADQRTAAGMDPVMIYDGPPEDVPTDDADRVLPYIVLWGSIGDDVPATERGVTWGGVTDVDWRPQLTLVAGLPYWVLGLVPLAREAIAAYRTRSGDLIWEDEGGPRTPQRDPDDSDTPRWFAVLPLRTLLAS